MKDELEDFIVHNKPAFDTLEPDATLWTKIEGGLNRKKTSETNSYNWIWKVAAMLFLAANLVLIFKIYNDSQDQQTLVAADDFNTELHEVESYYINLIHEKRKEINVQLETASIENQEFLKDIDMLDKLYEELKEDLNNNKNNDKLINAMIQNLQLRVEILNKQLNILEQLKNYEENDKITI